MPSAPARFCIHPGCRAIVRGASRCEKHAQAKAQASNAARPAYHAWYKGPGWKRERRAFLLAHPQCVACGAPASEVDHIRPHRGDAALFWDAANWQPLCLPCHSRKTTREDGGFGSTPKV